MPGDLVDNSVVIVAKHFELRRVMLFEYRCNEVSDRMPPEVWREIPDSKAVHRLAPG
jgi:hypothetical protein